MASKGLITDSDSLHVNGHNIAEALLKIVRETLYPKWEHKKAATKLPDYCDAP